MCISYLSQLVDCKYALKTIIGEERLDQNIFIKKLLELTETTDRLTEYSLKYQSTKIGWRNAFLY